MSTMVDSNRTAKTGEPGSQMQLEVETNNLNIMFLRPKPYTKINDSVCKDRPQNLSINFHENTIKNSYIYDA